jgi:hypothetical protein
MRYLLPTGGKLHQSFTGILTTWQHRGIPQAIKQGALWAGDNCAFRGFDADRFIAWLTKMEPYRATCLFIVVPDKVADAAGTLDLWREWQPRLKGWPLAFVAQDGLEWEECWPVTESLTDYCYNHLANDSDEAWYACKAAWLRECSAFDTLFIGGSTAWKLSPTAQYFMELAVTAGLNVHVGRVNGLARYKHLLLIKGSENFTVDGTRIAFERDKAIKDWSEYQQLIPLFQL